MESDVEITESQTVQFTIDRAGTVNWNQFYYDGGVNPGSPGEHQFLTLDGQIYLYNRTGSVSLALTPGSHTAIWQAWAYGQGRDYYTGYEGWVGSYDMQIESVPEPASMIGLALGSLAILRRRRVRIDQTPRLDQIEWRKQ